MPRPAVLATATLRSCVTLAAAALVSAAGAAARPLAAQVTQAEYASRRAALAALLPEGVTFAVGAPEPAADYVAFAQASRFLYLTGFREPGAALVVVKRGATVSTMLFVLPSDPAREVWIGRRAGVAGAGRLTGLPTRPSGELRKVLDSLAGAGLRLHHLANLTETGGVPAAEQLFVRQLAGARAPGARLDVAPTRLVDRLRGTKSAAELDLIRRAAAITADAERAAIAAARPGVNEFELQALIEYVFRRDGAERPSFSSIVGSGPNATTLHYDADDRFTRAGDLVVMDVGASYRGYAADVTRTVPVSGTFTPEQRAVYQLVRDAQRAAESRAVLGAPHAALEDTAATTIAVGLARLGLIDAPKAVYDCDDHRVCPQFALYYMHGVGHGIGLDVHDPEQSDAGRIAPGSAFTIEPGVYVGAALLAALPDTPRNRAFAARVRPVVERYRDVGVRIEDDYVATAQGVEWISRAPREADEIEAALAAPRTADVTRDSVKIEWYRKTDSGLGSRGSGLDEPAGVPTMPRPPTSHQTPSSDR